MTSHASAARPARLPARLSLFYAAYFTVAGVHLPFWPVWLESRGVSSAELGLLLAVGVWGRIAANPLAAHLADRSGERRRWMLFLAWGSCLLFLPFPLADGFWPLLAVSLATGLFWAPVLPLGDNLTLLTVYANRLDYGRIRVWGSASFIAAAALGGWLLGLRGASAIFVLVVAALFLNALACHLLPDTRAPAAERAGGAPAHLLLRQPLFLLFLLAGGLAASSHAVYYAFSALHWRANGLSERTIGLLWAEGVAAEIVLFVFGAAVLRRVRPTTLITCGAAAAALRWAVTAETISVPVLAALQLLHALSFGAVHLGAMHFLARAIPGELSASAQSLHSAITGGAALGLALIAAGPLYQAHGGGAFHAMALLAAAGTIAGLALAFAWGGGRLPNRPHLDADREERSRDH